jgi:aspartyl protease family protein
VRKTLVPAVALFGAVALGMVALRETVTDGVKAKTAITAETAALDAPKPIITANQIRTASLRKAGDGHFWATAYVNGEPIKLLVDTGASLVALNLRDARKAGIDTDKLSKNAEVRTAAGRVKAAMALLDKIEIDGVKVEDVQAVVIDEGLEHSLLGMSFLNRLDGWDVTANANILRQ